VPHYRINIKLEKQPVKEYIIEDGCKHIDLVYDNYRRRVIQKNGSGRVIYFDLVMIAEDSLKHLGDRKEVYNEQNNFGIDDLDFMIEPKKPKRFHAIKLTLAERNKKTLE
jgi:hypothetical protein